jgi:hypothetical protein
MDNDNVVVESNKDGSFNVKIKEGKTIYEIPNVMPVMDWLVKVTILCPSQGLTSVSSKIMTNIEDENELKIGQTWCEDIDDPFIVKRHARIDDIKDGYIKYHASYKSTMDNSNTYSCSEHTFKNYYPKRVE